MTVQVNAPLETFVYGGPGNYPFTFKVQHDYDLVVIYTGADGFPVALSLSTDYTVAIDSNDDGGTAVISYDVPVESGASLLISRDIPINQLVDWVNNNPFDMEILEGAVDKLTMICQDNYYRIDEISTIPWNAKGDLATFNGTIQTVLPAGDEQSVLTVKGSASTGLEWVPVTLFVGLKEVYDDKSPTLGGNLETADAEIAFNRNVGWDVVALLRLRGDDDGAELDFESSTDSHKLVIAGTTSTDKELTFEYNGSESLRLAYQPGNGTAYLTSPSGSMVVGPQSAGSLFLQAGGIGVIDFGSDVTVHGTDVVFTRDDGTEVAKMFAGEGSPNLNVDMSAGVDGFQLLNVIGKSGQNAGIGVTSDGVLEGWLAYGVGEGMTLASERKFFISSGLSADIEFNTGSPGIARFRCNAQLDGFHLNFADVGGSAKAQIFQVSTTDSVELKLKVLESSVGDINGFKVEAVDGAIPTISLADASGKVFGYQQGDDTTGYSIRSATGYDLSLAPVDGVIHALANLAVEDSDIVLADDTGAARGLIGLTSTNNAPFIGYAPNGVYEPSYGAVEFTGNGPQIYGQLTEIVSPGIRFSGLLNYANGGALNVDGNGNVVIIEPETAASEEDSSTSDQTVLLTAEPISGLEIPSLANTYEAGQSRIYVDVSFENTSARSGTLFLQLLVDSAPLGSSVSISVGENVSGSFPIDLLIATTLNAGQALAVQCWRADDAQAMSLSLDGSAKAHRLYVYQTVTGGGGGGENNYLSSVGTGESLDGGKISSALQIKSLTAGAGVTLSSSSTEVQISGGVSNSYNEILAANDVYELDLSLGSTGQVDTLYEVVPAASGDVTLSPATADITALPDGSHGVVTIHYDNTAGASVCSFSGWGTIEWGANGAPNMVAAGAKYLITLTVPKASDGTIRDAIGRWS